MTYLLCMTWLAAALLLSGTPVEALRHEDSPLRFRFDQERPLGTITQKKKEQTDTWSETWPKRPVANSPTSIMLPSMATHEGFQITSLNSEDPSASVYLSYAYSNLQPSPKLCTLATERAFASVQRITFDRQAKITIHFASEKAQKSARALLSVGTVLNLHKFEGVIENLPEVYGLLFEVTEILAAPISSRILCAHVQVAPLSDAFADGGHFSLQFHSVSPEIAQLADAGSSSGHTLRSGGQASDTHADDPKGKGKEEDTTQQKNTIQKKRKDDDDDPKEQKEFMIAQTRAQYAHYVVEAIKETDPYGPMHGEDRLAGDASPTVVTYEDTVTISWSLADGHVYHDTSQNAMLMLCYGIFNPFYYTDAKGQSPSFPPSCSLASGVFPLHTSEQGGTTTFAFPAPHAAHGLPHGYYYFQLVKALTANISDYETSVIGVSNSLLYVHSPFYTSGITDETAQEVAESVTFRSVCPQTPLRYDPIHAGQELQVKWSYQAGSGPKARQASLHLCLADMASYSPTYRQFAERANGGVLSSATSYVSALVKTATHVPEGPKLGAGESYWSTLLPIDDDDGTVTVQVPADLPSGAYFLEARTEHRKEEAQPPQAEASVQQQSFLGSWGAYLWGTSSAGEHPSAIPDDLVDYDDAEPIAEENETHTYRHASPLFIFNPAIPNNQIFVKQPKVSTHPTGGGKIEVSWDIGDRAAQTAAGFSTDHEDGVPTHAIIAVYQDVPGFPFPGFTGSAKDQPRITPTPVRLFERAIDIRSNSTYAIDFKDIDINKWIDGVSTLSRAFSYPIKGPAVQQDGEASPLRQQMNFFALLRKSLYWTQIREILRILPFPFYVQIRYECPTLDRRFSRENISDTTRSNCRGVAESQRFSIDDPFGNLTVPLDGLHFAVECGANATYSCRESRSGRKLVTPVERIVSPLCALTGSGRIAIATKTSLQAGGPSKAVTRADEGPSLDVRYAPSYLYIDTTTKRTQFHVDVDMRLRTPLNVHANMPFAFEGFWDRADALPEAKPYEKDAPIRYAIPIAERTLLGPLRVEIFGILFALEAKLTPACSLSVHVPEAFTALSLAPAVSFHVAADYRNFVSNEEIAAYDNMPDDERPPSPPQAGLSYAFSFAESTANVPQRLHFPADGPTEVDARLSGDIQIFAGVANVTLTVSPAIAIRSSLYAFSAQPAVRAELAAVGSHPPMPPYAIENVPVLVPALSACDSCAQWHSTEYRLTYTLCPFTLYSSHHLTATALTSAALTYAADKSAAGHAMHKRWDGLRGQPIKNDWYIQDGNVIPGRPTPRMTSVEGAYGYDYLCTPADESNAVTVLAGCAAYVPETHIAHIQAEGLIEALISRIPVSAALSHRRASEAVEETGVTLSADAIHRKLLALRYSVHDVNQILSSVFTSIAEARAEVKMLLRGNAVVEGEPSDENLSSTLATVKLEGFAFAPTMPTAATGEITSDTKSTVFLAVALWDAAALDPILVWLKERCTATVLEVIPVDSIVPVLPRYTPEDSSEVYFPLTAHQNVWAGRHSKVELSAYDTEMECTQLMNFLAPFPTLLQDLFGASTFREKREWVSMESAHRTPLESFYGKAIFLHPKLMLIDVLRGFTGVAVDSELANDALELPRPTTVRILKKAHEVAPDEPGAEAQPTIFDRLQEIYEFIQENVALRDAAILTALVVLAPFIYWLLIVEVPIFIL